MAEKSASSPPSSITRGLIPRCLAQRMQRQVAVRKLSISMNP
jgi:hypothetical protein